MNINPTFYFLTKLTTRLFLAMVSFLFANVAMAQNTVSGTVYNDLDGSAKGTFTNIQTGAETGTNGNGIIWVYVVKASTDEILATATVAANGTYTSTSYSTNGQNRNIYLVLDTVTRAVGDNLSAYYTIKMPAAWANTSPYMTATIDNGGSNLTNQNFGIQTNGFLTIPDFSVCAGSDSLFTWYFRGARTTLVNGTTVIENSATSEKVPFLKITATYFTNNVSYSVSPDIYAPSSYTIAGEGGLQPIPSALEYQNSVLEIDGSSTANGVNNDSIGIGLAFKNTNGQKIYIQKMNNAVLDLDTYESLKVTGYNNGTEVKPVIYVSNGYDDNTTNDMRSFYMGNTAWIFNVTTGYQQAFEPCNAWCDYSYNAVAIMEFPTPVDSIFYTARITEPTGNRDYDAGSLGSNEITGFNYCPVTIQGNLWNDANGNGIVDGAEANILNSGHFINLLDEYGRVLATTQIQPDGSYTFSNFPQLATTVTMKLQISATAGTIGSLPPTTAVPAGYITVSENQGGTIEIGAAANKEITLPLLLGSNLINYNFGIEQLPTAHIKSQTISYPTGNSIPQNIINQNVTGFDAEDGSLTNSNTIVITTLPVNATMLYAGNPVTPGQNISGFNPALLSFTGITNGSVAVVFNYAFKDAADQQGPATSYTINWLQALPVTLEYFTIAVTNCDKVVLNWKIKEAVNFSHFEVERNLNGSDFITAGFVSVDPALATYRFSESNISKGNYQYRLKMVDADGKVKYSSIVLALLDCNQQQIIVYPNPVVNNITLTGLNKKEKINLYTLDGALLYSKVVAGYQEQVDMSKYSSGAYKIIITNDKGDAVYSTTIVKQ